MIEATKVIYHSTGTVIRSPNFLPSKNCIEILSFFVKLKTMVLLRPVSRIKESVFPLISTGITIKLFINLKDILCLSFDFN